jgi:hypothetical protein
MARAAVARAVMARAVMARAAMARAVKTWNRSKYILLPVSTVLFVY